MTPVDTKSAARTVMIVTGLSGAGKSTALTAFEDLGFHSIDNLPLPLIPSLLDIKPTASRLAIGLDSRSLSFTPELFVETVKQVRERGDITCQVLLMDASDASLIRRYSETRRRHPLTPAIEDQNATNMEPVPLEMAISRERHMMQGVRQIVDAVVDTSDKTNTDTRRLIRDRYRLSHEGRMAVSVLSFGYSLGLPRDADMVYDVRFLRNPHYVPELRPLTGLVSDVSNYVKADEAFLPFVAQVEDTLSFLLPRYESEGKSYFTLAFGCTGGKHRSVTLAEHFGHYLATQGYQPRIDHRNAPAQDRRRIGDTG